ncbi:hypothetical protein IW261DRAFT_1513660 [Armillaria novae-zelandiae]|uniref:Zn(2)-C6 fungal-type domain-containing protein n=1 Tax=Armillaria novae-zelandiae TaxID=153914 RepID=A0AA39UA06_9AGAR|nr:hypothetical protein IW261DRAFT_1513660 [Armillaria novae-zelandiae]
MSGLTPSFYDTRVGLLQPSQDADDPWFQQNLNFYDYGQHQQPAQLVNGQSSMDPWQQQESYDSYDQIASNMLQSHLPPSAAQPPRKQPQKTPPNTKMHVLTARATDGNSDGGKIFRRRPGACTRCKQVKMKCDFAPGEQICHRCKPKGYHCVVESPKPKVYERERLLTEIRQKDAIIEELMKELHNPYLATPHSIDEYLESVSPSDRNNANVLAWLGRLKASVQINGENFKETSEETLGGSLYDQQCNLFARSTVQEHKEMPTQSTRVSDVPVEFRPGCEAQEIIPIPSTFHHFRISIKYTHIKLGYPGLRLGNSTGLNSAEILVLGIVTLGDAEKLFDIFYTYVHPFLALLDPVLITPKSTLARCPILFTVICAIASRYHPPKSSIYRVAMHFAKCSAANALVLDEMKSVELCQAFLLMSIYTVPEGSWDRDQTWLYIGIAVSIATALHLNQTPKSNSVTVTESEEREYLNRVRVWQFCFLLYQGIAIQIGKPSGWMMKEYTVIRHSGEWYRQSLYNLDYDVYLCGYSALVLIIARFHEEALLDQGKFINPLRGNLRDITMRYDAEIQNFMEEWQKKFKVGGARETMLRHSELHFYVAYFRLVMFSFGFHQVFHAGIETLYDYFFNKCLEYAQSVIRCMNENLAPSGFMRYAPDRQFMCAAFAVALLFKLLQPEFSSLLNEADKDEIVKLIGILITTFSSTDIAIDNRHTPMLYAKFLASVLGKYRYSGQGTALQHSQPFSPGHTETSMNIAGEVNKESSDNWRKSYVAQGYDSASFTFMPEATHAPGSWPTQFGSGAEFPRVLDANQNINGSGGVGNQPPGSMQDEAQISNQMFDNFEWLQRMLMPGLTWNSSERG